MALSKILTTNFLVCIVFEILHVFFAFFSKIKSFQNYNITPHTSSTNTPSTLSSNRLSSSQYPPPVFRPHYFPPNNTSHNTNTYPSSVPAAVPQPISYTSFPKPPTPSSEPLSPSSLSAPAAFCMPTRTKSKLSTPEKRKNLEPENNKKRQKP